MSWWKKNVAPPPELVTRVREQIVDPLVTNAITPPQIDPKEKISVSIERSLQNFRPEYADGIREKIRLAKAECAALGLDYDAIVSELGKNALHELRVMANASDVELIRSRIAELPEDRVFYSWQSPESAELLVQDPAAYWEQIAKQGFFMAETTTNTSGYSGAAALGVMIEIHVKKGTPFADLTPFSVDRELQRRQLWHTSSTTHDGTKKPLNRYNGASGWWQLTLHTDATFHRFDPTAKDRAELLADLAEIKTPGLPFFTGAVNRVLIEQGEPVNGSLAAGVLAILERRAEGTLAKWHGSPYKQYEGSYLYLGATYLVMERDHPALGDRVRRDLAALSIPDLQILADRLDELVPEPKYPPVAGARMIAGAIAAEATRRLTGSEPAEREVLEAIAAKANEAAQTLP
jgi:hypothetical protein